MTAELAVIVPCYNSNPVFLEEALASLSLAAAPFDCQKLVVDDGSKDASTLQSIATAAGFEYLRKPNGGLASARNFGVQYTDSRYLSFCDDDDRVFGNKYELQLAAMNHRPEAVSYTGSQWFDDAGAIEPFQYFTSEEVEERLMYGNLFHVNSVLLSRQQFDTVNGFDESLPMLEDWDFWLRLQLAGFSFQGMPTICSEVRVHPGQMSQNRERMNRYMATVCEKYAHRFEDFPGDVDQQRAYRFASAWATYMQNSDQQSWRGWFKFTRIHIGQLATLALWVKKKIWRS